MPGCPADPQLGLRQAANHQHLNLGAIGCQALGQPAQDAGLAPRDGPGRTQAKLCGRDALPAGALMGLLVPDLQHGSLERRPVARQQGQQVVCFGGVHRQLSGGGISTATGVWPVLFKVFALFFHEASPGCGLVTVAVPGVQQQGGLHRDIGATVISGVQPAAVAVEVALD